MSRRTVVGIWTEWAVGAGWTNEGMTRLLGFLIEGLAQNQKYMFRIVVNRAIYDEALADLKTLEAKNGMDFVLHTPAQSDPSDHADIEATLALANSLDDVEGWISLYPYFEHALRLKKPVTTIFPDAIPIEFPMFGPGIWEEDGAHTQWRRRVARLLEGSSRIITFSQHIAQRHVQSIFDIPPDRISVVPHAPPDLEGLLPFVKDRKRTPESLAQAANILRAHARERGWGYLQNFPFEDVRFIVVSTQDRPTKNIALAAEAVRKLVRRDHFDIKMLTTAAIHSTAITWTRFPGMLDAEQLHVDILALHNLPRREHAALYHCASLAVHPSLLEGGRGTFPYYEAASVGTPCVMAKGPNTDELLVHEPSLAPWMFEPDDSNQLAALIRATIEDRSHALDVQQAAYLRLAERTWGQVAAEYAQAALTPDRPKLSLRQMFKSWAVQTFNVSRG